MKKPNIVLILADDMGYGDLSCLNDESKIHTPHMDRMAERGMTFTDAHASSAVCTPSRYSILTGRYSWRGPLQHGVLGPAEAPLITGDIYTWPQFLKDNGYITALIGKWHLGLDWPFRTPTDPRTLKRNSPETHKALWDIDYTKRINNGPVDRGFDTWFGVDIPNFPPYCWIHNDRTVGIPSVEKPPYEVMMGDAGPMLPGWDYEQLVPTLTAKTEEYIDAHAGDDEPFFLMHSSTAPHTPIAPSDEWKGTSKAGVYGDFVQQLDATVGRINAALEKNGILENTLVILTSDNGSPGRNGSLEAPGTVVEKFGHNSSWILRGRKAAIWDGGHRVPFIAQMPGTIAAGTKCGAMICLMDLFATSAALLNRELPSHAAEDSFNLLPLLKGETDKVRTELANQGGDGLLGIRRDNWKLILGPGSGSNFFNPNPPITNYTELMQLYDMEGDIRERHNRYFDYRDKVNELMEILGRHIEGSTAPHAVQR